MQSPVQPERNSSRDALGARRCASWTTVPLVRSHAPAGTPVALRANVAVTSVSKVELVWNVKGTPPLASPTILTEIARRLASESELANAALHLQRSLCTLLNISDAVVAWIDWPRRVAWTTTGRLSSQTEELVLQVAGSGHREVLGGAVIEPVGRAPARAALALRRPSGQRFGADECHAIATLAQAVAPTLDRLISGRP